MLAHLSIRNFALIDRAAIDFEQGYSVITGETGSGKSILLGALNLILGERADYSVIRDPLQKTIVEARFSLSDSYKVWFEENDIDWDQETIIRREITAQGKSRTFVNDTPIQLTQLRELTEQLIYIHSQHETLELKSARFQMDLLDVYGDTLALAEQTKMCFLNWKALKNKQHQLIQSTADLQREMDYVQFQLDELNQLELQNTQYALLEDELKRLGQVDELRFTFAAIDQGLNAENGPIDSLRSIKNTVDKWKKLDEKLVNTSDRLQSCLIELDDLAADALNQLELLEVNPERLLQITASVDRFNSMLRKHQVNSQDELIELEAVFRSKVNRVEQSDNELEALQAEIERTTIELNALASELFTQRQQNCLPLSKHLMEKLHQLKLADAQIQFVLSPTEQLDANGGMAIQLLFSANKGMELKSVEKAASGGELSRLMLAIQATLSRKKALPTLILDEIDTGVSGEVALRIGMMLREMGQQMQLVAISHLPQVAAKASSHYEVAKQTDGENTLTSIQSLNENERVIAIAKLLSGDTLTEVSKTNARLLMEA